MHAEPSAPAAEAVESAGRAPEAVENAGRAREAAPKRARTAKAAPKRASTAKAAPKRARTAKAAPKRARTAKAAPRQRAPAVVKREPLAASGEEASSDSDAAAAAGATPLPLTPECSSVDSGIELSPAQSPKPSGTCAEPRAETTFLDTDAAKAFPLAPMMLVHLFAQFCRSTQTPLAL
jgi:hypothetical protein